MEPIHNNNNNKTEQQQPQQQKLQKTILLIRHAESEENRRIHSLTQCWRQLLRFSLPSSSDVRLALQLLHVSSQVDTNVSEDVGRYQIEFMQQKLQQDHFIQQYGIQLIAHSPLERAKQTCQGMLGCSSNDNSNSDGTTTTATTNPSLSSSSKVNDDNHSSTPSTYIRVVQLMELTEKTPSEWIPFYTSSLYRRIDQLETWLSQQPESVICLVGHSQFFKAMLQLDFKFHNCDVWQVTFDEQQQQIQSSSQQPNEEEKKEINHNNKSTKVSTTAPTTDPAITLTTTTPATTSTDGDIPTAATTTTTTWKLPPRWTNLKHLYACDISRQTMSSSSQQQQPQQQQEHEQQHQ